ncbi:MAG: hypothetical protein OJF48_001952 [Afipia sp.]|jgi:hypothetical protein|nr:MAG: hypothetical protein OJF48_001952 [Afipia sp.]
MPANIKILSMTAQNKTFFGGFWYSRSETR